MFMRQVKSLKWWKSTTGGGIGPDSLWAVASLLGYSEVADSAWIPELASVPAAAKRAVRHPVAVRVTHWLSALAFLALVVSGVELVISHPRFYWGEEGNVLTTPLFQLPIPASRGIVNTGYSFVLPDQNGWSRYMHFQAAWLLVLTGLFYVVYGFVTGHFRRNLLPAEGDRSLAAMLASVRNHLRFKRPDPASAESYNLLQRLAYLKVIFILIPLMIWTGLAMSPAVTAALPFVVTVLGGQQSARTIHFVVTIALLVFLAVHIGMVILAGFKKRMRAMITGQQEHIHE